MSFGNREVLWLLPMLPPALVVFLWWSWRKREVLMARFISARLLPGLLSGLSRTRQKIRFAALVLAVVCLILALARPQWGFNWEEVKQRGLDIVVAIDTSKSMLAADIAPNRLARAKLAALDLMRLARADRLGLVAFAGDAFLQCPLTIDDAAFRQSVDALDVKLLPQGGTALAAAIHTALTAFKEGENFKVLVLLTDGEDHDSNAVEVARKAAEAGLQIFTIGIGTAEGELLRITKPDGSSDYVRDEQGNVVKSHLDEGLLREIAGATSKGFYLKLTGAKTVESLFENGLAPLPKSDSRERLVKRYHERYQWPLGLAILLLVTEMLLPERKRVRKAAAAAPGQPAAAGALAVLLAFGLAESVSGSPASALRDYKSGDYEQALKEYEQLLQRKSDDLRLQFNAGTAAFRNQQFDAAAKHFSKSLDSPDLKLQEHAYYNRGNSLYWLGEQLPDPSKKAETWQKSLKDFESSLKLNPQDADARFNHEFVKKRLEELKQEQQQQNKQDQNKNQDQQQQDKQQQQQQDQQQQSKQDQQQQQQQSSGQEQRQQLQQQQSQEQSAQQQQQQPQPSQDQKEPQQAEAGEKNDKEKHDEQGQAYAAGQMTPQQAEQLLDGEKGEEKLLQFKPEGKPQDRSKPIKDW